ncbi:MAG TPA: hypothetical protein VL346_04960, partial [Acidobacteriaceae bacterium]|nr:hypothetical protein [Acidobacteriaceae bacterium]
QIDRKLGKAPLRTEWRPDLLGGVMVIEGEWADGAKLTAIPNYARMNRVGPPHAYPGEEEAGSKSAVNPASASEVSIEKPSVRSKVWI